MHDAFSHCSHMKCGKKSVRVGIMWKQSRCVTGKMLCSGIVPELDCLRLETPERSVSHLATFRHRIWALYAAFALIAHQSSEAAHNPMGKQRSRHSEIRCLFCVSIAMTTTGIYQSEWAANVVGRNPHTLHISTCALYSFAQFVP